MGREIRQVPPDWEHPRDEKGHYRPLYDGTQLTRIIEHIRYDLPFYIRHPQYFGEWFEAWPDREYSRPRWRRGTAAHFQIYETVSEGTPVSPIFATREGLANWLVEQGHSRKAADEFARRGYAFSMLLTPTGIYMNVDIYDLPEERDA